MPATAVTAAAAETTAAPVTTVMHVEGFEFVAPDGDYTVWFEEEPVPQDQQVPLPDGTFDRRDDLP